MRIKIAAVIYATLGLSSFVFGQQHHFQLASATPATTPAGQSITGDWIIHFQAGHQSVSGDLHLQADGKRVTGTIETAHTGAGTIVGKWTNQKFSATCTFEKHESVILEGELKNDSTLAGKYTTEGRTETWQAETAATAASASAVNGVYAQYEKLIGTWDVTGPDGGPPIAVQRFTWGPNRSYIWHAGSFIGPDGKEEPHFEGMLVWNGVHKNVDVLATLDLQSGRAQEQGTFSVAPDGTIVREITGVFSEGSRPIGEAKVGADGMSKHFRQTYKSDGPDKLITAVMRETSDGSWVATFPGSEKLVMRRRKS